MKCVHPLAALWYKGGESQDDPNLVRPKIVDEFRDGMDLDFLLHESGLPMSLWGRVEPVLLPCGKCDYCRLEKSAEWTARNLMESRYHEHGCYLTLTCSPEHIESVFPNGSLRHKPFQDFMKRLRKKHEVRYMMCGEYGDNFGRPHYHCLLYGYDFPDRVFHTFDEKGFPLFRSAELSEFWPFGFAWIGELMLGSIQYVCRYVLKKLQNTKEYGTRAPEYIRMSRNPGIGAQFYHEFGDMLFSHGVDLQFPNSYVYCGDFKQKVPRYFDKLFEKAHNADYVSLKNYRRANADTLLSLRESDLREAEEYIKTITKGRIKKGVFNV